LSIYTFEDTLAGVEFDAEMSNIEREQYLADNPHIRQLLTRINVCDPVRIGVTKAPSDFQKYVLGKVKERNPGADVERAAGPLTREF
jgi:hypothetical protein